jgi:two-component system, chemotaxis family, chemotaxis protein CheY
MPAETSVLIVDDSPTIRRMVRVALSDIEAVSFLEAANGLEAIERLSLSPVSLMVLDLNMPDMHGLEVLAFVRRHPKYARLPVIVLTTRGDDESRTLAERAGATEYLTKPFSAPVVASRVRALLQTPGASSGGEESRGQR